MNKTPQKVTKDPMRQERGKKSHETYLKTLKEDILRDNHLSTSSSTNNFTTRSSDVFFVYNKKFFRLQIKNKPTKNNSNLLNHQNDVTCFRISLRENPIHK